MSTLHLTRASISLANLDHNMRLLTRVAGARPLWPAIKADAYGHGARIIAERLVSRGYTTLCTAHIDEALVLQQAGIRARFVILSPDLGGSGDEIVEHGFEPVVCTYRQLEALGAAASRRSGKIPVHLKVDTGMGRAGFAVETILEAVKQATGVGGIRIASLMSHFPRADEVDKSYSRAQTARFASLIESARALGVPLFHMANSAAIFELPEAHFDLCRPGIAIYGLKPSVDCLNPRCGELKPVMSLSSRITQLKTVGEGTGLSYGHTFTTARSSLIATIPVGYGDGLRRGLSNRMEVLVGGARCPQVGTICMDQCLVDVSDVPGEVRQGDEVVLIGRQGDQEISADEMAAHLGTINYEIVTGIAARVPRIATESGSHLSYQAQA